MKRAGRIPEQKVRLDQMQVSKAGSLSSVAYASPGRITMCGIRQAR